MRRSDAAHSRGRFACASANARFRAVRWRRDGTHGKNTVVSTKPLRKTAIAIPEDVLEQVDDAARASGESRSRYISKVLRLAVRARSNAEITRRLDELFSDADVVAEQKRAAADLDSAGTRWDDERW